MIYQTRVTKFFKNIIFGEIWCVMWSGEMVAITTKQGA